MMENKLVKVEEESKDRFAVIHEGIHVGSISLHRYADRLEVSFECFEPYRGNHYLSNAVYLFTKELHLKEEVNQIHAIVSHDNEMAIHILEHSGYFIDSKDEKYRYYTHRPFQTKKAEAIDNALYLAGGCFWGMEKAFRQLTGVLSTCTGYANGRMENPNYEDIIRNETGYKETVRVIFDPEKITVKKILKAYFLCIDPTVENRQGEDIGEQYQTGVYYTDERYAKTLNAYFDEEKKKYPVFKVELKPLENFYEAEEYHQDYLSKNPQGYCHISFAEIAKVRALNEEEG